MKETLEEMVTRIKGENTKLRQALENILHVDGCSYVEDKEDILEIAREALNGAE